MKFRLPTLLFLLLLPSAFLRAQQTDASPVVKEEKMVVEANTFAGPAAGADQVAVGGAQPVADQSWGGIAAGFANLQVESSGTNSFGSVFSLRGIANTPFFSDPAVTLYFDDIPLARNFTYPTDLFGFASATIYRGPQGTVFGHAGDGGVIRLQLPETPTTGGGELTLSAGDYDAASAALQAAGAIGSQADATVAASYTERAGTINNTQIHQTVGDERALTAFARTRYRPSRTSEISVELLAGGHRDGAQPLVPLGGPLTTVQRAREGETDTDMAGAAVKATFDTGEGRLTAVTSYTDSRLDPYQDWLVLPPPLNSYLTQSEEAWSEEVHLVSNPGAGKGWSTGAWLSDSRTIGAVDRSILGLVPIQESDYGSTACSAALFGEAWYDPAPGWHAALGVRFEYDAKDFDHDEQVPAAGLHFHELDSNSFFLPKLAIGRVLGPDTTAEASVSLGSRPGGFSPYTDKPALIPYAAEHTAAFEAGVTSLFAQNDVSLTARVFATAIQNYQIEQSFSPTDYLIATAPRARSLGSEVEAQVHPLPGWTLDAVVGITDATLVRFNDPLTGESFDGSRAPYAPAATADLGAGYRAARGLFGRVDLTAKGKTFYTESENPIYAQGAYAVLNARAGYDAHRWRLTVYLDNIAGRGYYTQIVPGVNSGSPGAPRTFGSELALKF